jgi:hypothetical protein
VGLDRQPPTRELTSAARRDPVQTGGEGGRKAEAKGATQLTDSGREPDSRAPAGGELAERFLRTFERVDGPIDADARLPVESFAIQGDLRFARDGDRRSDAERGKAAPDESDRYRLPGRGRGRRLLARGR